MRKVTSEIIDAFLAGKSKNIGNTETDGESMWLHGNKIAERKPDGLWISNAGWFSNTTKERLNGIPGVSINQKNYVWYLNGLKWDGEWVRVGYAYSKS